MLGEASSRLAAFSFDAGDRHRIISSRLMTHPCDGGCFRSLLNGNASSTRYGAAADRGCVIGNAISEFFRYRLVARIEIQEMQNGGSEIRFVLDLLILATLAAGLQCLLVAGRGAFDEQF